MLVSPRLYQVQVQISVMEMHINIGTDILKDTIDSTLDDIHKPM